MAEILTPQQKMVVEDRGGSLLVSAAAGSGKTKVLVDRLLRYVMDPVDPANLDDFLIITYTKAAASELRSKIAAKLAERIAQNPENRHLQRQMQRIYLARISTVHAFCSDILKEYAYQLDIPADFRMAEETECEQMQSMVLEKVLDEAYENISQLPDLQAFVNTQGLGRDDRQIPLIIQKVYHSAKCHLNPKKWLAACVEATDFTKVSDASQTPWGAYLIQDLHKCLDLHKNAYYNAMHQLSSVEGMEKVLEILNSDLDFLNILRQCETWDELHNNGSISWKRFPSKYSDKDLAEKIKAIRNACKEDVGKRLVFFTDASARVMDDLTQCGASARGLVHLVERFSAEYDKLKKVRRVMDFSDLEHCMLDLLWGRRRESLTATARELGTRFREIMVDEYQDSNAVQDAIFRALTQDRNNCFMVGDVKQSIYQFRLADPTIFLEKYNHYADACDAKPGDPRRILLSYNFRSAGEVISAVNDVFARNMSEDVGGLTYGQKEMLREGVPHPLQSEPEVELHALQVNEDTYAEEAAFTANRIRQLLDGTHTVRTKDGFRPITPDDIVILLRSPGSVGLEFCYALEEAGIPCSMGGGEDLLEAEEISDLYALLQTISNPLQDIALTATLTSRFFCFTADELAHIRGSKKYMPIFESLKRSQSEKVKSFLETLNDFRSQSKMCTITQLIEYIFAKTGIDSVYASMVDGNNRINNLQEFCRLASACEATGRTELDQFLEHLDALAQKGMVISSDQKPAGAVTVMSIHKSKGLEFPVVFLCGLSRRFNHRSAAEQVLCDKDLGLGLACVDSEQRVRYPSIAKRAIALKIKSEGISEEMRVLYVAMTRAKDRLIMTYAQQHLTAAVTDIALRTDLSSPRLMAYDVTHPGKWILQTAMLRTEAGQLHALGGHPDSCQVSDNPWLICYHDTVNSSAAEAKENVVESMELPSVNVDRIRKFLRFQYTHTLATTAPSKQTATQLKGRFRDEEAASNAPISHHQHKFRKPSFVQKDTGGISYGNAVHGLMQHLDYVHCQNTGDIEQEILRLTQQGYLDADMAKVISAEQVAAFFQTEVGQKLCSAPNVLREFKFSILDNADRYVAGLVGEKVLLQGVVDCAILEEDGITILDFKTDKVTVKTVSDVALHYRAQIHAYAQALSRIFEKPIKASYLYFFSVNQLVLSE